VYAPPLPSNSGKRTDLVSNTLARWSQGSAPLAFACVQNTKILVYYQPVKQEERWPSMKTFARTVLLGIALVLISGIQSYAQSNTGKAFYTLEEARQRCGVPVDPAKTPGLKAEQDSGYKDYLSKIGKDRGRLFNIETVPDWKWAMSDVEDQGDCWNCWVHAATGITEGQLSILYGSRLNVDLNEHEIPNDCAGGFPVTAEIYIKSNKMTSETGSYPNLQGAKWTITSYNPIRSWNHCN
jgi:hypothetical protein